MEEAVEEGFHGVNKAVEYLENRLPDPLRKIKVAIICGSGLSDLYLSLDKDQTLVKIPYEDIPGFPKTTVPGHSGELVVGTVNGGKLNVLLMRGRFHTYEGHSMQTCTLPVRVFKKLGAEILFVTNAAGGINVNFEVGDVMIISDHIGFPLFAGKHPLVGHNDPEFGVRFPPMSNAYDPILSHSLLECAEKCGLKEIVRPSGVYTMVSGPTFETKAEIAMLRSFGTDAVGMSTVPEVVVARHCGMRVVGFSLITNKALLPGDEGKPASHEEVLETTAIRSKELVQLVSEFLCMLASDTFSSLDEPRITSLLENKKSQKIKHQLINKTVIDTLQKLDLSSISPIQALSLLSELKSQITKSFN